MCPESFGGVRFDLRSLLQGRMWALILIIRDGSVGPVSRYRDQFTEIL